MWKREFGKLYGEQLMKTKPSVLNVLKTWCNIILPIVYPIIYNSLFTIFFCFYKNFKWRIKYLVRDIKPPNNQSCFPNFFHKFFSVKAVEKENKFLIGPKQVFFFSFLDHWKVVFSSGQLRKIRGKDLVKQDWLFGDLMSRIR